MVHQVSSDHVARVGYAPGRPAAVFRHEQQSRGFDRIRRDDIDPGLDGTAFAPLPGIGLVSYELDLADQSVLTDDDLARDHALREFHKPRIPRVVQRDGWIVFRLDRADRNAIRVAGASAPIPVRLGISCGRNASDRNSGGRRSHSQELGLILGQRISV